MYFVEVVLHRKLDTQIDGETLGEITRRIFDYDERRGLAEYRFREWLRTKWPDLKEDEVTCPRSSGALTIAPRATRTSL